MQALHTWNLLFCGGFQHFAELPAMQCWHLLRAGRSQLCHKVPGLPGGNCLSQCRSQQLFPVCILRAWQVCRERFCTMLSVSRR